MSVTRINDFQAKDGKTQELREFLGGVVKFISTLSGCHACRLLESQEKPGRFVVFEVWESKEAHQAAAKKIPPEMFQKAMQLLAEPPKGEYYSDL